MLLKIGVSHGHSDASKASRQDPVGAAVHCWSPHSQPTVHSWGVQINALVVVVLVLVLVRVRMGDGGLAEQLSLLKLAR